MRTWFIVVLVLLLAPLIVQRPIVRLLPARADAVATARYVFQRLVLVALMVMLVAEAFRSASQLALAFAGFFAFYGLFSGVMAVVGVVMAARPAWFVGVRSSSGRRAKLVRARFLALVVVVAVTVGLAIGWGMGVFVGVLATGVVAYGPVFTRGR